MNKAYNFGVNVWWTVPEFIVDSDKAQDVLAKYGFESGEKGVMPAPSRRAEVSRAVYSFQNLRKHDNRSVTEKVDDNPDYVVYGILGLEEKSKTEVGFGQNTTVRYHKETGSVTATGELVSEFYEALRQYENSLISDDIRSFLRKVISMVHGIPKRPKGGFYFVPGQYIGILESAQSVLDELGTGAKLYIEELVNGVNERANVWASVEESLSENLEKTMIAVRRIERSTKCLANQEAKLHQSQELVEIYTSLLGEEAKYENLRNSLEEAISEVASKMVTIETEKAERKKERGPVSVKPHEEALTAAKVVLAANGGAMHVNDIIEGVNKMGFDLGRGDGDRKVMNSLNIASKDEGEYGIHKEKKGTYSLVEQD